MKYNYYIVFQHKEENGSITVGNIDVSRNKRITTIEDIRSIEDDISKKYNAGQVLIVNWRRFEDED